MLFDLQDIVFENKWVLSLLVVIPIIWIASYFRKNNYYSVVHYSSIGNLPKEKPWKIFLLKWLRILLRSLVIALIIIALARPQTSSSWQDVSSEGIDIAIAMDISSSMMAQDLKPNRLEASKRVAQDFIDDRQNDRLALVVYAGESFTQCPLTTDHAVLKNLIGDINFGMIEDGTAIGMGLITAVNRLKKSDALSKIIILLTDGENNKGEIPPLTAAEIAKKFGIRVYTIGVGTNGKAKMPFQDRFGRTIYQYVDVKIDEKTLQNIAKTTGGNYFRASSNAKLKAIYQEIDKLEKTRFEVIEHRDKHEAFALFALLALLLLLGEFMIEHIVFKRLI